MSVVMHRNLRKWVDKRLAADEPLMFIRVVRQSGKHRDPAQNQIGELPVRDGDSDVMTAEQIVAELTDLADTDADARKGFQKFDFEAYHGDVNTPVARFAYSKDGGSQIESDAEEGSYIEDTSQAGQTSMIMRHVQTVFASAAGMQQRATQMYERMVEAQSEELERARQENAQMRKEIGEIKIEERQAARDLRKQIWKEEKMEQIVDQIIPLAGVAAAGIARKVLPPAQAQVAEGMLRQMSSGGGPNGAGGRGPTVPQPPSEMELMIRSFVSSLKTEQFGKLMGALEPGQQASMMKLVQHFVSEKEAEEKRIEDKMKAEGIDPALADKPSLA
jgi:hypothetical protein